MKAIIVQVVQHLRPGGIETMALDLMNQLDSQCEMHIFSLEGTIQQAIAQWPRLQAWQHRLHFFNKQPGLQPQLGWAMSRQLKQLNACAVHTHHIGPLCYGGIAAKLAGITKHIHTEHDAWHLHNKASYRLENLLIALLQPTLVADCDQVAKEMLFYFPSSDPKVILNGIDVNHFRPANSAQKRVARHTLNLPEQSIIIGCAARLETVKGHQFLLQALSNSANCFTLALAGDGSLRDELKARARDLGVADRVIFLGAISNMVPFYQAIDLFCLPSLNEGLPLSPLEAQSSGIPVILTNVGGCKSIVDKRSGQLVPPRDALALQRAFSHFEAQNFTQNSTQNPRPFVVQSASLEKTANAYFSLFGVKSTQ